MRAARPSSTAGSSFPCRTALLSWNHKQWTRTSTSIPPLVHTHTHKHNQTPAATLLRHTLFVCVSVHQSISLQPDEPGCLFSSPTCPGVILPGDTQQVEFIFKSEKPGIETELWQLNTHPVLLQGASVQVMLRGVALQQDKTADQRLFIEVLIQLNCGQLSV